MDDGVSEETFEITWPYNGTGPEAQMCCGDVSGCGLSWLLCKGLELLQTVRDFDRCESLFADTVDLRVNVATDGRISGKDDVINVFLPVKIMAMRSMPDRCGLAACRIRGLR